MQYNTEPSIRVILPDCPDVLFPVPGVDGDKGLYI